MRILSLILVIALLTLLSALFIRIYIKLDQCYQGIDASEAKLQERLIRGEFSNNEAELAWSKLFERAGNCDTLVTQDTGIPYSFVNLVAKLITTRDRLIH